MENQSTYRIRTKLGETEPINIPVKLMQEYNSFEILSLKINTNDTYRTYTSTEGIVVGRVSTANNGLGIPNVRVSIFVPKGAYDQNDEEKVLYPFSSPSDKDGDRVRYNLLPSDSDVTCYQVIGTLPTKRKILDNETVCEVFEKYYKYTTVTNEAGDFMLVNIPVGKQRLHIDADLSDIGPFLSQKPYNMIENLGFEKNKFESTTQFKSSKDLDSLAQVISQDKSVYVYPYWGDITENGAEMKITRTDLSLNYEFKTQAIFMGSVITDKSANSIRQNCTATENAGKMSDMVTGPGRIEMIRKTIDNKIEQYKVKGDALINDNGVWCYAVPMNLDYVRTDEFGNIIPTDDPNKGVPTRARVRFRITLNQMPSDEDAHKRCSYLVPNNPKKDDDMFLKTNECDYSFGSDTWDESFVDLFWNKVYTIKNYVPQFQKTTRPTNRKHTGIKMVNHFGDNNPFPYNKMTIKLPFLYRLICVIIKIFILLVTALNFMISIIGALPCWLANLPIGFKVWKFRVLFYPFKPIMKFVPPCISISAEFCDDGVNKNETYPGCISGGGILGCVWDKKTKPDCEAEQYEASMRGEEAAVCTVNDNQLINCVENQLAQQNEATSFNFGNDWINGCLYMPLWYRHIRPKKSFFFGLFKRRAKDQWCAGEKNIDGRSLKLTSFCSPPNQKTVTGLDFKGKPVTHNITSIANNCGDDCHVERHSISLENGVIMRRETMLGQTVWYYKAAEVASALTWDVAMEYLNSEGRPMLSKLLYATDIVLLGSLNECDMNGIPKFFNYLKGSTYNMPTDVLFSDTEISYQFDANGKLMGQSSYQTSVAAGCDWGNENEFGYDDGGLFYSIGCATIDVNTESCINLRRICELGVGQDEMQYIENINVNITNENDDIDRYNTNYYLRPDGFISYDDIIDFDYRSMFATLNGNNLKTKLNQETGLREYDFIPLYIDNFDGSLSEIMADVLRSRGAANYKNNYRLETTNKDYLTFRHGDRPFFYDGVRLVNYAAFNYAGPGVFSLPKYNNSFYFYFGLKEGKTAIDLFNQQYNEPCISKTEEEETIKYEVKGNSWCNKETSDNYRHDDYDGFLNINLSDIPLPCSIDFNSRTNGSVTYHIENVTTENLNISKSSGVNIEYTFGVGDGQRTIPNCKMLNNDEYVMIITDAEGNYHTFNINVANKLLQYRTTKEKFGQSNDVLLEKYNNSFVNVNKAGNFTDVVFDEENNPHIGRNDGEFKLNGLISVYDVIYDGDFLTNFVIEIKPSNIEKWIEKSGLTSGYINTNFSYNLVIGCGGYNEQSVTFDSNGYITKTVTSDGRIVNKTSNIGGVLYKLFGIKCALGGVDYSVRITQLCQDSKGWYKTNNSVESVVDIEEPTPYKLYINDIDYDIIKRFETGWGLNSSTGMQTPNSYTLPFTTGSETKVDNIKGWTKISKIGKENQSDTDMYYDWSVDKEQYGDTNLIIEKIGNEYAAFVYLEKKESFKPEEPKRSEYDNEAEYQNAYVKWGGLTYNWMDGKCNIRHIDVPTKINEAETDDNFEVRYKNWENYCEYFLKEVFGEQKPQRETTAEYNIKIEEWQTRLSERTGIEKVVRIIDETDDEYNVRLKEWENEGEKIVGDKPTREEYETEEEYQIAVDEWENDVIQQTGEEKPVKREAESEESYNARVSVWEWECAEMANYEKQASESDDEWKNKCFNILGVPKPIRETESEYSHKLLKWKQDFITLTGVEEPTQVKSSGGETDEQFDTRKNECVWLNKIIDNVINVSNEKLEEPLNVINNRLSFVESMKDTFWLKCKDDTKTITYSVRTDDTPYSIWSIYNAEKEIEGKEGLPHETDYRPGVGVEGWKCTGAAEVSISDINVPTISSIDSAEFGYQWKSETGICFARNNLSSQVIKPPYLVACVNAAGITKPNGLTKNDFFVSKLNKYGINQNVFGEGSKYVTKNGKSFFGVHIIDKIFRADMYAWSYMFNIPYFLPNFGYNATDPRLGGEIKTEGILYGGVKNGYTEDEGYIKDFREKNVLGADDTLLKTYIGDDEDSIPTRRCIIYNDTEVKLVLDDNDGSIILKTEVGGDEIFSISKSELSSTIYEQGSVYQTYEVNNCNKITIGWDKNGAIENVPYNLPDDVKTNVSVTINSEDINVINLGNEIKNSIKLKYNNYRNVAPSLISDTNQYQLVPNEIGEAVFTDAKGECTVTQKIYGTMKVDLLSKINDCETNQITIKVWGSGLDEDELFDITGETETTDGVKFYLYEVNGNTYPLNSFDKKGDSYYMECNNSTASWTNGNSGNYLFNSTTNIDSSGEIMSNKTGEFTNRSHKAYFVIAETEDKRNKAISPVFDFTEVQYLMYPLDLGYKKILRTMPINLIKNDGTCNNYYLVHFDYETSYNIYGINNENITSPKVTKISGLDDDKFKNGNVDDIYYYGDGPYNIVIKKEYKVYGNVKKDTSKTALPTPLDNEKNYIYNTGGENYLLYCNVNGEITYILCEELPETYEMLTEDNVWFRYDSGKHMVNCILNGDKCDTTVYRILERDSTYTCPIIGTSMYTSFKCEKNGNVTRSVTNSPLTDISSDKNFMFIYAYRNTGDLSDSYGLASFSITIDTIELKSVSEDPSQIKEMFKYWDKEITIEQFNSIDKNNLNLSSVLYYITDNPNKIVHRCRLMNKTSQTTPFISVTKLDEINELKWVELSYGNNKGIYQ